MADLLSLWAREPTPIFSLPKAQLVTVPLDSRHAPWPFFSLAEPTLLWDIEPRDGLYGNTGRPRDDQRWKIARPAKRIDVVSPDVEKIFNGFASAIQ